MKIFPLKPSETLRLLIALAIVAVIITVGVVADRNLNALDTSRRECVVNCMDGAVQDVIKKHMQNRYHVYYIDPITEAGPNKILADNQDQPIVNNIIKRIKIARDHHGAKVAALVGHEGCAGNPRSKEEQIAHLYEAKKVVESFKLDMEIILLWVDKDLNVHRIE